MNNQSRIQDVKGEGDEAHQDQHDGGGEGSQFPLPEHIIRKLPPHMRLMIRCVRGLLKKYSNVMVAHIPMLTLMKYSGIITGDFINPRFRCIHTMFSAMLMIFPIINVIRYLALLWHPDSSLHHGIDALSMFGFVCILFNILVLMMRSSFFYLSFGDRLHSIYDELSDIRKQLPGLCFVLVGLRANLLASFICLAVLSIDLALNINIGLQKDTLGVVPLRRYYPKITEESYYSSVLVPIDSLIFLSTDACFHLVAVFFLAISQSLRATFNALAMDLQEAASDEKIAKYSPSELADMLRVRRRLHLRIAALVKKFDDQMYMVIAPMFCVNIVGILIIIYSLLWGESSLHTDRLYVKSGLSLFLSYHIFYTIYIVLTSSLLYEAAHQHLAIIHNMRIRLTQLTEMVNHQTHMFISQIAHDEIGISLFKLFVMKRESLLTIFGALFTYFIILMDFSGHDVSEMTATEDQRVCNCSDSITTTTLPSE